MYDVSVEDIDLDLYQGDLAVYNFRAIPRKEFIVNREKKPTAVFDIEAPEVVLKDFNILGYVFRGNIQFDGFVTFAPKGKLYLTGVKKENRTRSKSPVEQLSTDKFPIINIHNILISQADVDLVWVPDSSVILDIDSLNFNLRDIKMDSSTIKEPIPFHVDGFTLNILGFEGDLMKYHKIKTGRIMYHDLNETLEIDNIQLIPKYTQKQYHEMIGYQSDWFALTVEALKVHGFDITKYAEDNQIYIDQIEVAKPNALIQRDRNVDLPPYKFKALPVSQIKGMPIDLNVREVKVNGARVEYNEQSTRNIGPGKIFFSDMDVSVKNVTNNSEAIAADKVMALNANAKLMGEGNIRLKMDFDLSQDDDRFFADGQLDTMNFAALNPLTENLLLVHLDSGLAQRMQFQFIANEDSAVGRMSFAYRNLHITAFKESKSGDFQRMGLINNLANTFMKTKNVQGRKFQEGRIAFRRKKDRYLFNYLGKCIQTGLVETVVPPGEKKLFKIDGSLIK